jgi:hypothetical protein
MRSPLIIFFHVILRCDIIYDRIYISFYFKNYNNTIYKNILGEIKQYHCDKKLYSSYSLYRHRANSCKYKNDNNNYIHSDYTDDFDKQERSSHRWK